MAPKRQHDVSDPEGRQNKRIKTNAGAAVPGAVSVNTPTFVNARGISAALHIYNTSQLAINLNGLRTFAAPGAWSDSIAEDRVRLLVDWIEGPGIQDVERVLDSTKNLFSVLTPLFSFLGHVVRALRTRPDAVGGVIAFGNALLSDRHAERLNRAVRQDDASLVLSCLKLWLELASVDALQERVAATWNWGGKAGTKLLSMRRKGNMNPTDDPIRHPDIRTSYILFLLSFLTPSTPSSLKQSFLSQKDTFTAIFRDLRRDHTAIIRKVLEVSWGGIWEDRRVRRTAKISVFNEWLLNQILRLYERGDNDDPSQPFSPADLAHHFLLAICTRPGVGVCFPDNGWYPRESEFGEENEVAIDDGDIEAGQGHSSRKARLYNIILANFIKVLKVGEDARQQELALKILEACPELVAAYWPAANISLEPRLSSRWIINAAFVGRVISLPVPLGCFRLSSSSLSSDADERSYRPDPPPLPTLFANAFPSLLNRTHLTKGLQAKQGLVQLLTAQTLTRCFEKLERTCSEMLKIAEVLGETPDEGQWRTRRMELQSEARRRVPDFSVIIAFSQQKIEGDGEAAEKKRAMLKEVALRLLWCYQRSLPDLVAEFRFDAGKLFTPRYCESFQGVPSEDQEHINQLSELCQLHALRLLRTSEQFNWSAKPSGFPHSFLYYFLLIRAKTRHTALKCASEELVQHLLGTSLLFEHDPNELQVWLEALPTSIRDGTVEDLDGAPLTDEAHGVISVLDDSVQRCLKTPYRYVEELGALLTTEDDAGIPLSARAPSLPSPLFMTLLEQLKAKHRVGTLSFSDTIALLAFIRRLITGLVGKQQSLKSASLLTTRLSEIVNSFDENHVTQSVTTSPRKQDYLIREVSLLSDSLELVSGGILHTSTPPPTPVSFVQEITEAPVSDDPESNRRVVSRLVDKFRLRSSPLPGSQLKDLVQAVLDKSPDGSQLRELLLLLSPKHENLWSIFSVKEAGDILEHAGSIFFVGYLHAAISNLESPEIIDTLARLAEPLLQAPYQATLLLNCLLGRLSAVRKRPDCGSKDEHACLHLLSAVLQLPLSPKIKQRFKETLFSESQIMKEIFSTPEGFTKVLTPIVKVYLNATSDDDRRLAAPYCEACLHMNVPQLARSKDWVSCWIPYLTSQQSAPLAERLIVAMAIEPDVADLLVVVLATLALNASDDIRPILKIIVLVIQQDEIFRNENALLALKNLCQLTLPLYIESSSFSPDTHVKGRAAIAVQQFRHVVQCSDEPVTISANSMKPDARISLALASLTYRTASIRQQLAQCIEESGSVIPWADTVSLVQNLLEAEILLPLEKRQLKSLSAAKSFIRKLLNSILLSVEDAQLMESCEQALRSYVLLAGVPEVAAQITLTIPSTSPMPFNRHSLRFINWMVSRDDDAEMRNCLIAFADSVLRWLVRRFSEDESDSLDLLKGLVPFGKIMRKNGSLKRHLVEPVLTSIIRSRFTVVEPVEFACVLCEMVDLPSDVSMRYLQSVLQQPQLRQASAASNPRLHCALVRLVHTLCLVHPQTACQPAQLRQVLTLYGGSLSIADRRIVNLLRMFEKQRSATALSLLATGLHGASSTRVIDLLCSLDAARILKTCVEFPQWREFNTEVDTVPETDQSDLYDPVYVFGLFSAVVSQESLKGLEWVRIGRTNVMSLAICALASKQARMRKVAATLIGATWTAIQSTEFIERDQLSYTLQLVRNVLASETDPERLPTFTVLLAAYAVHSLFHPAVLVYPHIAHFLLQRPALDPTDVPMLYNMLYPTSDDWRRERLWMLRFLSQGMRSAADWHAFRRRRAWDLLATLFSSEPEDRAVRPAIFEVLGSLTRSRYATHALVLRSSLLAWIELQLFTPKPGECLPWLRVLENICMVVNPVKMETDTYGSWRADITRCVGKVLRAVPVEKGALRALELGGRVILRLALLQGEQYWPIREVLDQCVTLLTEVERYLGDTPVPGPYVEEQSAQYHCSITPGEVPLSAEEAGERWAVCVRQLWRVGMSLPLDAEPQEGRERYRWWMELTPRLISLGSAGGEEAEWAREEVLRDIVLRSVELEDT
ncbi:hypothetical protein DACRYDRAFT_95959 [Dacryopinax primogenitus]|uniref:Nucleolar pre-ribosomal-associated protein 1 C-terminal domain-containing protein n=1 Tax=Dacryopinax primogenitus (strain DJM 731) TaxID=1858805 RepID=M5FVJ2_DACPD|nr:uncharacterized protein DACRYDRAFT_95959 [Dacryopinax primogenitus]EJT99629.1 hypothetical protein DACRYDRAFT_95959 [Dacryopinax primogenitus]